MRFTAISGLVFAALLQVGQQPGVTSPAGGAFTGGAVAGQILGPSGACNTVAYAFSAATNAGIGFYAPTTETLLCVGGGPALSTGSSVGSPVQAYSYGWIQPGIANGAQARYGFFGTAGVAEAELAFITDDLTSAKWFGTFKILTESANTGFLTYTIPGGASGGTLDYKISAFDAGSEQQALVGTIRWAAVNKGGTVTCATGEIGTPLNAVSVGTLTATFACSAGAGSLTLQANAVSSLTQTAIIMRWVNMQISDSAYDATVP